MLCRCRPPHRRNSATDIILIIGCPAMPGPTAAWSISRKTDGTNYSVIRAMALPTNAQANHAFARRLRDSRRGYRGIARRVKFADLEGDSSADHFARTSCRAWTKRCVILRANDARMMRDIASREFRGCGARQEAKSGRKGAERRQAEHPNGRGFG